ncbi:hypothetical protein LINPERHAP1_LOCUS32143 [Linum perenne]
MWNDWKTSANSFDVMKLCRL